MDFVLHTLLFKLVLLLILSTSEKKGPPGSLLLLILGLIFLNVRCKRAINGCKLVPQFGLFKVHIDLISDLVDLLLGLNFTLFFVLFGNFVPVILDIAKQLVDSSSCISQNITHIEAWNARCSRSRILLLSRGHLVLLESFLGLFGSLFLLNDLLNVQIGKLVLNLSLLLGQSGLVGGLPLAQALLKRVVLLLLVHVGLTHHLLIVAIATLHELHELIAHLFLVLGTHGELVTNGSLLSLKLLLLLALESVKTFLFELLVLLLSRLDTLTLLIVVWILEHFINLALQVVLVLLDKVSLLLVELAVNSLLGFLGLLLDFLGVLLFFEFSTTLKTFLQNSVQLLLLTLLVSVHET